MTTSPHESLLSYDVEQWIEENKTDFVPPVCNKCMFSDQLMVFFIGGPNERKDYHLEEGEEVFYQLFGDMCLKVFSEGVFHDVPIKEGEMFLLPAKVHHSPQRFQDTVGFVVERRRNSKERDALKYFKDEASSDKEVLFERWVHLKDVVKDLPPIMNAYFESPAHATRQPDADSLTPSKRAYEAVGGRRKLPLPFNLMQWVVNNKSLIIKEGHHILFGPPSTATTVSIYSEGKHNVEGMPNAEVLVWMFIGSGHLTTADNGVKALKEGYMARVPVCQGFVLTVDDRCFCITITMPTPSA